MNKSNWSFFVGWLVLALTGVFVEGCHKADFLGKNPNSTLVVPSTLSDFQSLLDNDQVMNYVPALGELSADNYYMGDDLWQTVGTRVQNAYLWKPDIFGGQGVVEDWNVPYQQVYYANVVLDGLDKVKTDNSNIAIWNSIKGQALFTRAFGLFNVAQLFAPAYDEDSAATEAGIPLRLVEDVQSPVTRSTVKQTYEQITGDLRTAAMLLPSRVLMTYVNRATRPAALAMLARVYLSMREYDSASVYADSA
ncbi:MAG: RagB/SusD family nutrient uptake outer membrane protein, partial [Bacteroidetes bacterium]|nr:RagB/SusD family nutrient uptake outer membrane protein [Bacteroidota bacterium]